MDLLEILQINFDSCNTVEYKKDILMGVFCDNLLCYVQFTEITSNLS